MFAEDFTPFFDATSGFATLATVGGVAGVAVLFDNGAVVGGVGMLGMATNQPSITLPTSFVPSNPVGSTVIVNATTYLVAESNPDGTGISRLLLESAT